MMDDLQQAYSAYQQALYHLSDPKVSDGPLRTLRLCLLTPPRNRSFGTA